MNIEKKLNQIPTIYYFNLDQDVERRDYMLSQFDYFKIKNIQRVSGSQFLANEIHTWKDKLIGTYKYDLDYHVANFVTHINFFKNWLKNTNEEYLIIMEDDYDLSLIDYWHFSWEYFMNNLPANWDCIQLGYEHPEYIIFCLHFKPPLDHLFGPCLLNRNFVKKLVKIYYNNGKFLLNNKLGFSKEFSIACPYSVDTAIIGDGITYRVPLITTNFDLCRPERKNILSWHKSVIETYYYWWKNKRDNFSLDDFFTYAHRNVENMAQPVKKYLGE